MNWSNWNSIAEFLAMGGRAVYVWPAFAMCAAVIAFECISLRRARRKLLAQLRMSTTS